jgi:zinc protease
MAFRDPSTVGAYRTQIVERLFGSMLSARLDELAQKPDAPFMNAGSYRSLFVKSAEASTLMAIAKDGKVAPTLEALFTEAERVTRFGFTQTELDREKTGLLRGLTQSMARKDKRQSVQLANEYVRNFTQAEPFPVSRTKSRSRSACCRAFRWRGEWPGSRMDARRQPRRHGERTTETRCHGA